MKRTNEESKLSSLEPFREILPLISGSILLLLATPPYGLFVFAYLAIGAGLLSLRKNRFGFLKGFLFGMIYNISSMYWIVYVLSKYGNLPLPASAFLFLLLSCYLSIYPALFFKAVERFAGKLPVFLEIIAFSLTWTVLEFVRGNFMTGFPWMLIGYTQGGFLPMAQTVNAAGIYGLGFIIIFSNLAFLKSADFFKEKKKTKLLPAAVALVLILSASLYGMFRIDFLKKKFSEKKALTVMCVQGNIDQSEKWEKSLQEKIVHKYINLSREGLSPAVDLIIWPETAIPFIYGMDAAMTEYFKDAIKKGNFPKLITGYPGFKWDEAGKLGLTNSAGIFSQGELLERYDKIHLVPFGEYVPLKKILFFVNKLVAAAGDFLSGEYAAPFTVSRAKAGALICYESIFPEIAGEYKKKGADFLVNITNDAWFGDSPAPHQHFAMSAFRAIENECYLVRVANTGISGIVTPWGKSVVKTPLFKEAVFTGKIYY